MWLELVLASKNSLEMVVLSLYLLLFYYVIYNIILQVK